MTLFDVSTEREIDYGLEDEILTIDYLVNLIHQDSGIPQHKIVPILREKLGVADSRWAEFKGARIHSFKKTETKRKSAIDVEYSLKNAEGQWVTRKESHAESAREELGNALRDLIPFALSTLEMSTERDEENVELYGAVFKYCDDKQETMSVSLLARTKTTLEETLNLPPTPPRFEQPPGDGDDESKVYDTDTSRLVDRLLNEIRRYLAGERL